MLLTPTARRAITQLIFDDLRISQTTASSLAGRIGIGVSTVETILADLEIDDLVSTSTIKDTITVYRLTDLGIQFTFSLYDQPQ